MQQFLSILTVLGTVVFVTSDVSAGHATVPPTIQLSSDLVVAHPAGTMLASDCYYGGGAYRSSYRPIYYPRPAYRGVSPYSRGYGGGGFYGGGYGIQQRGYRGGGYSPYGRRGYRGGSGFGLYINF